MHRILYIIQKEFLQILREKAFIGLIFGMPVVQILIFGFAVTTDVHHVPIAFTDQDHSSISRRIIDAFRSTRSFSFTGSARSEQEALAWMDEGKIQIAIVIPADFEKDLRSGQRPEIQAILDGVDGNSAGIILAYVNQISINLQKEWLRHSGQIESKDVHLTEIIPRMWYNASMESKNNIVPGVIAILLTMITAFLTGMNIVKEKEIGTLEQLMVTPIRKTELIIGKTIPFMVVGFLLLNVGICIAGLIFGIWMKGSLLTLYFLSLIFMLSTLGLGIFASTIATTQQQAMFVTWFFALFALLLSGFFIPIENMPRVIQTITLLNPLRYYMRTIREIYLKGTPLLYLWKEALTMLLFGIMTVSLAVLRFRKRVG
jgi:ABC-2 type transport system permease protein